LEGKLTNIIIRWYGYILRMNREDPKGGFQHESKRKMPKRKTEIKVAKGKERCYTE
jgi:hypothetical protein